MIEPIGPRLRKIREQWGLSLRDIEERSSRLAEQMENPSCQISASWLARVEREEHELTATKLVALAAIYNLSCDEVFGWYGSGRASPGIGKAASAPNTTLPLRNESVNVELKSALAQSADTTYPPEQTALLPAPAKSSPSLNLRVIIGRHDRSLDPMIRAGAVLEVDTQRRTILPRKRWTNEFNRPIYLLLSRTGYMCGWCELDPEGMWLTLIPHPLSHASSQRWRFKKDIEVVGQVTAVYMTMDLDA
jgi:transcriptional regulator with XRE-family HTH domain